MFTRDFWMAVLVRAIRTFYAVIAAIGARVLIPDTEVVDG